VIVVDRGRIVADGPAKSLIDDRRIDAAFAVASTGLKTPDGLAAARCDRRTLIGPRKNRLISRPG